MPDCFTNDELLQLIPQRPPIVMVDLLEHVTPEEADSGLTIAEDNIFVQDGHMLEPGLIEHIAQSAAAFAGCRTFLSGEAPKVGYIGEIRRMTFHQLPPVGAQLHTHIKVLAEAGGITLLEAETHVGDQLIADGQMKIFINA